MLLILGLHKGKSKIKPRGWVIPRIERGHAPLPVIPTGAHEKHFTVEDVPVIRERVRERAYTQRTHDVKITSLLRQNDVLTILWRYFTSCVSWVAVVMHDFGISIALYTNVKWAKILTNRLFVQPILQVNNKLTSKFYITRALCKGNPSVIGGFPSLKVTNAESVSMPWRHHEMTSIWGWLRAECGVPIANAL